MLALTDGSTPFSRLACQIELDDSHEGLVLGMPTDQHRGRHAEFTKHRSQYVPASLIQPPCTRRR
ncbi:hypothetical protein [Nevskia sp.]|uniref:hypothetical protein n=1 Tax=Nevskia sp. TaxID=1929292 RepID=UPI0025E2DE5C|nr:hypothetical protein [Nevskia sp.]